MTNCSRASVSHGTPEAETRRAPFGALLVFRGCQIDLLLAADKLWIGFHSTLGVIHTFVLVLFGDPDTHDRLEDAPDNQAGHEDPDKDGDGADDLATEAGVAVGNRYQQQTEQTADTVNGDGTNRVINAQLVQGDNAYDYQQTTKGTEDGRQQRSGGVRASGDGHQASECTVQKHGQVSLAKHQAGKDQGREATTGCCSIGVHEHDGYVVGRFCRGGRQNRATVEAEPAHPQDEGTQSGQGQVGTRNGTDLTVRAVFAFTSTQQEHASQSCSRTGHVNDTGAGKVTEAQVAQVIHAEDIGFAPGPGTFHRVDEAGHDNCEDQESPELHALGNRAGDDGHGGSHENHLEEEVCRRGVSCCRLVLEALFNAHAGDAAQEGAATVHDGVAADHVHGAGNGVQGDVLGQDFSGVL